MGSCLGVNQRQAGTGGGRAGGGGGGGRRSRHRSRRPSTAFSDSTSSANGPGGGGGGSSTGGLHTSKNRPLRHERIRWKSDIPLTEGQLKSKRDEFWDTAPAFEGKAEIWAALKAAAEAAEPGGNQDFDLAQAILDGAGVSLPHGSLIECYDELGTRYAIPVYCLSFPINMVSDSDHDRDSPADFSEPVLESGGEQQQVAGEDYKIKIRVSLTSQDVRMVVNTAETVAAAKKKLQMLQEGVAEPARQRWYFGGKLLGDKMRIGSANIPPGYVVQCIVNPLDFAMIRTK